MCLLATGGFLDEAENVVRNTAEVTLAIRGEDTKQALASLLGKVGLLENTLGGVNIRQVESCAGVARVENGC